MEFDNCIFSRKSCRDYLKKEVPVPLMSVRTEEKMIYPESVKLEDDILELIKSSNINYSFSVG